eukprot:symbB.v1.2.002325.t1/scaffold123.1/size315817/10
MRVLSPNSGPDEVVQRLSRLYGDERHADVTFVVRLNEEIPEGTTTARSINGFQESPAQHFVAHRSLVSAWSEPLSLMLCGNFAEGNSREVKIFDVEPNAFEVLLKLIYTGVADISPENVLSILDVAVRFDVSPLVQFAVQFLQNHATSEHACRMLEAWRAWE